MLELFVICSCVTCFEFNVDDGLRLLVVLFWFVVVGYVAWLLVHLFACYVFSASLFVYWFIDLRWLVCVW